MDTEALFVVKTKPKYKKKTNYIIINKKCKRADQKTKSQTILFYQSENETYWY